MASNNGLCAFCAFEPFVHRQDVPEQEFGMPQVISRVGPEGGRVPPELESAIQRARGRGQPLESALRDQISASLGHDFSDVRIHTDLEADELSRRLTANAFTVGSDIFFRRGAYDPATINGRELIAHELIHVVQQHSNRMSSKGSVMVVHPADDALEREADALTAIVTGARSAQTRPVVKQKPCEGRVVQRALAGRVSNIFGAGGGTWQGIATSCHFATVYWIFLEQFNRPPTVDDFANSIGDPTLAIKRMLRLGGLRKKRPNRGDLKLPIGSILVFAENKEPRHSCVATSATRIGGYNQQGWFSQGGLNHGFSSHNTNQIMWGTGFRRSDQVKRAVGDHWYKLYAIREEAAKNILGQIVGG